MPFENRSVVDVDEMAFVGLDFMPFKILFIRDTPVECAEVPPNPRFLGFPVEGL